MAVRLAGLDGLRTLPAEQHGLDQLVAGLVEQAPAIVASQRVQLVPDQLRIKQPELLEASRSYSGFSTLLNQGPGASSLMTRNPADVFLGAKRAIEMQPGP